MAGHIASSGKATWRTPGAIIGVVRAFFGGEIDLDPCATGNPDDAIALGCYCLPASGLEYEWGGASVFVNPPFGTTFIKGVECITGKKLKDHCAEGGNPDGWSKQTISQWVEKSDMENRINGAEVVMLLPAAVDVAWWQRIILPGAAGVCFIRGRIKFVGAEAHAPMACALVYFGAKGRRFREYFGRLGYCLVMP